MARTVTITGGREVRANIDKIIAASAPQIMKAVNQGNGIVENKAKHLCPGPDSGTGKSGYRRTGNLRRSIMAQPATYEHNAITGKVIASAEYAIFVECGTGSTGKGSYPYSTATPLHYKADWVGQIAQPYLVPALLRSANQIEVLVARAIKQATKV